MNGSSSIPENPKNPHWLPHESGFATVAIHARYKPKEYSFAPVVPSITLSTTFEQDGSGVQRGFDYKSRTNPTRQILETTLAALDKGKYGHVFSSGLAATTNVISMLNTGYHVISMDDVYGGTGRLFRQMEKSAGIITKFGS